MNEVMEFRCGFVGLLGPTNAGKSTLLNALIGKKISIVSDRAQTTYHAIRGILNRPQSQIIWVDTPGLQNYKESIARLLNKVASKESEGVDLVVWVFDVSERNIFHQLDRYAPKIKNLGGASRNICLLNKIDAIPKPSLLPILEKVHALELFAEVIPVSAKKKDGIERIVKAVEARIAIAPPFYPIDRITDRSNDFILSEVVREKIYELTRQEIPYSVRVELDAWEDGPKQPVVRAIIHVDSDSKKPILLGKQGSKIKEIGIRAREQAEAILGYPICLKLFVDVEPDWKSDSRKVSHYLELS